jgi:hypothetical protein
VLYQVSGRVVFLLLGGISTIYIRKKGCDIYRALFTLCEKNNIYIV